MIVSLDHVFKYYGADCILRDVCAAINEKDRIGLVGANGEGKTTLLNVLTGALDYEEGTIGRTNGKIIGYLKQNSGLANGKPSSRRWRRCLPTCWHFEMRSTPCKKDGAGAR